MHSTWHEGVYHATQGCQAASLSLTALSLRGLKRACQVESQKNAGFLARLEGYRRNLELIFPRNCGGVKASSILFSEEGKDHAKDTKDLHSRV